MSATLAQLLNWLWPGDELWWRGAWASVALPTALTLAWMLSRLNKVAREAEVLDWAVAQAEPNPDRGPAVLFGVVALTCAAISASSGVWVVTQESVSLHLMPAGFTVVAVLLYWRVPLSPGYAYALTYLSLLLADVVNALLQFGPRGSQWWEGLGGAGLADGLFFFPMVSALLVGYARLRAKSGSL